MSGSQETPVDMMKAKEIQDLLDFIAKSGLDEVNIETEQFKISVKRHSLKSAESTAPSVAPVAVVPVLQAVAPAATQSAAESKYVSIKSPMIGTFYRSANPDSPSFVNVGDEVKSGQTVCIIEAMKLFNEIESEVTGKVVKILVDNASPVEYDQPLFLVEPA